MAVDKLVDSTQLDSDLTSVANAIRTKGGTSALLAFPADFVSAINAISGGGGTVQYKLLKSGSYTKADAAAGTLNISTGYYAEAGKTFVVLVTVDAPVENVAQTYKWACVYTGSLPSTLNEAFTAIKSAYYKTATGNATLAYGNCSYTRTTGVIALSNYTSGYKIQPNTYNWYIWEVATVA